MSEPRKVQSERRPVPTAGTAAGGGAGLLLFLGMAGGVAAVVADLGGSVVVGLAGVVVMVVAVTGAGVLAVRDSRRRGRSVLGSLGDSVREVFRWIAFLF